MCLLLTSATFAQDVYQPANLSADEVLRWKDMDANAAGNALLELRDKDDCENFAIHLKVLFDEGRSVSDILHILHIVGLPLQNDEVDALLELAMNTPIPIRIRNLNEHGYSFEAYYPDRLELVLLNESEKAIHARAIELAAEKKVSIATNLSSDLEGRLCVWTGERKIFLGGNHVAYETAASILSHPATPESLRAPAEE